jgi:hypothetical protein
VYLICCLSSCSRVSERAGRERGGFEVAVLSLRIAGAVEAETLRDERGAGSPKLRAIAVSDADHAFQRLPQPRYLNAEALYVISLSGVDYFHLPD